jgi:Domain of unknown function (DUF4158)
MPVEFLSDDQVAAYDRFAGPPRRAQLERYFFLDDVDRKLVDRRPATKPPRLRVQLGTVRFLGTGRALPHGATLHPQLRRDLTLWLAERPSWPGADSTPEPARAPGSQLEAQEAACSEGA